MELWIRSQDKEILKQAYHLDIYNLSDTESGRCWFIEESGTTLGTYNSKERALEVLDEICEHIEKAGENEIISNEMHIMTGIKHFGKIYEMPKE